METKKELSPNTPEPKNQVSKEFYDAEQEINKLCEEHKIYFTDKREFEGLRIAKLLNLVHNELLTFLEQKKNNGYYILTIKNPNTEEKYPLQIKYEGEINNLEGKGNDPKRQEILDLLNTEEINFNFLDLGEVNGVFYYGFKINEQEAIIVSNGEVYRNSEEKIYNPKIKRTEIIGENEIKTLFSYEGYIGDIAPTIAKETIKTFFTKQQRNHLIKPKEIYKVIRDKILYYMDFSGKDEIADVLTCWIIATYCYPLFYWFPHILINAPSTSGKSKAGYIIIKLSFRGFDLGASGGVSPPQIFRTLEGNRGTILCDEFEQNKKGAGADTQQLVNQIFNASASKDAYVIRVEQLNGKWIAKKFPIYCPKVSCNISGINPTSLSRYLGFSWLKTSSEKGRRKPQKDKEFSQIQQKIYLLMLENWESIKDIYENIELPNLINRDEDNWQPIYSIAKFIDQTEGEEVNAENQINKYVESYKEIQIETGDNTEDFFNILFENVSEEQKYYTPKEIGEWSLIQDLLSYLKSPAHWIGKVLKAYKFKDTRGGGIRRYLLSKDLVKKIIDLYFKRETTHNTTPHTQQHKQHIITQKEEEKDKNVVLCGGCGIINEGGIDQFTPEELKETGWTKESLNDYLQKEEPPFPVEKINLEKDDSKSPWGSKKWLEKVQENFKEPDEN